MDMSLPSGFKETRLSMEADQLESDYNELCKLIQMLKRPNGTEIRSDYVLEIIGSYNSDRDFIEKAMDLKMPYIKQVLMSHMHFYNSEEEVTEVNQFLSNAFTNEIESLVLHGGSVELERFKQGVFNILGNVNEEVHLCWFGIEEDTLKSIRK